MMELFDKSILSFDTKDLLVDIDELLEEYAPEGKSIKDFTGGYIEQLVNGDQLVCYYGTKKDTNNRDTVKIKILTDELDLFYIMLKAKIHETRSDKLRNDTVSMAQRRLARKDKGTTR